MWIVVLSFPQMAWVDLPTETLTKSHVSYFPFEQTYKNMNFWLDLRGTECSRQTEDVKEEIILTHPH
jgi:hypothetical protein